MVRRLRGADGWFAVLLGFAVIARLYHFTHPPDDIHEFRQVQTLMYAASYGHGAPLLAPAGNWFGIAPHAAVLEFPVYSMLVYWFGKALGLLYAGRLLTLAFSLLAIFVFDRLLALQGHPRRRTAVILFGLAPAAVFYGHAVQPEPLLLLLVLVSAYGMVRGDTPSVAVSLVALVLAATIKPTALITAAPAFLYLGWSRKRLPVVLAGLFVAGVATLGWAAYDRHLLLREAPQWYQVNTVSSWLFGTAKERPSPYVWEQLVGRAGLILLPPLTAGLLIRTAGDRAGNPFWWWWLAGGLATIGIFTHLNLVHFYYQLLLIPGLAALAAHGAPAWPGRPLVAAGVAAGLAFLVVAGCWDLYQVNPTYYDAGAALANAPAGRPVLVLSRAGDTQPWYPTVLYYSGHNGWNLPLGAGAAEIDALPGPVACELVEVFDGGTRSDLPTGWVLERRAADYALARRAGAGCP